MASDLLESFILAFLARSESRVCAGDLIRACTKHSGAGRHAVKRALKDLVAAGQIHYTNLFGCTQVDLAWSRPHRVSPRILLYPGDFPANHQLPSDAMILRIAGGAAFGAGDHPTTRLSLQALDALFTEKRIARGVAVLDIGTGTGVLAIGAVLLGAGTALALDIDPCALWEAKENVALNNLALRIRVSADPVEDLVETFNLIIANLRLPTLLRLTPTVDHLLATKGVAVVSGIRPEETDALLKHWSALGLKPCWREEQQGWAGIGFCRDGKRG